MYTSLLNIFENFIDLNKKEIEQIKSLFIPLKIEKKTILIDRGEFSDTVYFIVSGYLRYFGIGSDGKEVTIHLLAPGEFGVSFCSFVNNIMSNEVLHAVTDADLLAITKKDIEGLFESSIKFQKFGRKLMEYFLLEKEKRLINQISLNASQRYLNLVNNTPGLIKNVPVGYLASYIGISPESLSRIKKQIFLTNVK
jgi:CRP-like cAMP-binding protein